MTRNELRIICYALGFHGALILGLPDEKRTVRAIADAKYTEAFCIAKLPHLINDGLDEAKSRAANLLDQYLTELQEKGSARLEHGRATLLEIYTLLRLSRFSDDLKIKEEDLFLNATEEEIAAHIVKLADKELRSRERG